VDWATKHNLIQAFMARHGLDATDPRVQLIDLQYHDLRHEHGLYYRLRAHGRIERVLTDETITTAIDTPPANSRAFFRGETIRRFSAHVIAAGWDAVVFDTGQHGHQRVMLPDPSLGTDTLTRALFEANDTIDGFLGALFAAPESTTGSLG
jgi:proteasome accessory factor A